MNDVREKIRAIIRGLGDCEMAADLIVDVVARGLGKLGGRPRKHPPDETPKPVNNGLSTGSQPDTKPADTVPPTPPSDPISYSQSSDPDPERAIPVPRAQVRKAKKPIAEPTYPDEFEAFWGKSGIGSKTEALRAWEQTGRTPPEVLIPAWKRWQAIAWVDGFGVPHVSTWLRRFDWKQEPTARPRPRAGAPPEKGAPLPPEAKTVPKTPPEARGWTGERP